MLPITPSFFQLPSPVEDGEHSRVLGFAGFLVTVTAMYVVAASYFLGSF